MADRVAAGVKFAPELANIVAARRFVRTQLSGIVPDSVVEDLQLATSELVTNAVEHGAPQPIMLRLTVHGGRVSVTVDSAGPATGVGPVTDWRIASLEEVAGRGLGIVRRLADEVDVESTERRFCVTVHVDLPLPEGSGGGRADRDGR